MKCSNLLSATQKPRQSDKLSYDINAKEE